MGVDFTDRKESETWVTKQSLEFLSAVAGRAALRALPSIYRAKDETAEEIALISFRSLLTTMCNAHGWDRLEYPNLQEVSKITAKSTLSATTATALRGTDGSVRSAARAAALSCLVSTDATARSGRDSAFLSTVHATARAAGWGNISDCYNASSIDTQIAVEKLLTEPLWIGQNEPSYIGNDRVRFVDKLRQKAAWSFWLRFYEGMWNGTFTEWEIALEVIKIPDEEWEKDYQRIGSLIAEIEARLALQKRISELEVAVLDEHAQQRGIGDNHPPAPIDDISSVPAELVVLWEPLLDIKTEARAEKPDINRVKKAVSVLVSIASACGGWTWEKTNTFIDAGLKTAGAAAGTALLAYLSGHGDKIASVVDAALKWIGLLP